MYRELLIAFGNSVFDNFLRILGQKASLWYNGKDEVDQLENELGTLKALLKDASKKHKKDEIFRNWEKRIREVVYDVEDALETFTNEISGEKETNLKRIGLLRIQQVKYMREEKVKPLLNEAITAFASSSESDSTAAAEDLQTKDIRQKKRDYVVGFEDEANTLIKYLLGSSEELQVISVVGMPGLGKTTVAWKIFKDPRTVFEFHTRIWVNISEDVNMKNVLFTILSKFTDPNPGMTIEELAEAVRSQLEKGKFLIVMDDIWTTATWNEIKSFLPMRNKNGRVLITSRQKDVAWHANPTLGPHNLRFLTQEESWKLLRYEVYGNVEAVDIELEHIGKVIANLCDGLPLSIIVIGGILLDKISTAGGSRSSIRKEWEDVSNSIQTYLIYEDKNKKLEKIISLSYAKLPYELRDCFLYLGMFPEDAQIPAKKLTLLWIAEGFVQKIPGKSLEETSMYILKDLINRNLVMVEINKPNGDVKACRVHDTIREFCKTEATHKNQNLFEEISWSKEGVFEPSIENINKTCRRICIHSHVTEFSSRKPKVPKVRSFLCFPQGPINLKQKDIPSLTSAFNVLRVFEAENIIFLKFPADLMRRVFLRYLNLTVASKNLPANISSLRNLQTLIINFPSRTIEIKADIWKMMQLRHLITKSSIILKNVGKGEGGENLQTLGRLSPESCTDDVFENAKNLITLGIQGGLATIFHSNLEKLARLNKLKLVHDVCDPEGPEQSLQQLPEPSRFPPKLKTLVLAGTCLSWEYMSVLGRLDSLELLKLKDNAFVGNSWHVDNGSFDHLELLHIERADLESWTVSSDDAFPKLRSLFLKNCENLRGVPLRIGKSLEELYMARVTTSAKVSGEEIKREKQQALGHERGKREVFKLEIAPDGRN